MSAARLYAVQLGGVHVTVRAEVFLPSIADQDAGDAPIVHFEAVNGVKVHRLRLSEREWDLLTELLFDAEVERRAAEREERAG